MKKNNKKIIFGLLCFYIISVLIIYRRIIGYETTSIDIILLLISSLFLVTSITLFLISRKNENEREVEEYYQNIRTHVVKNIKIDSQNNTLEKQNEEKISDILELMSIHMKEIKDYYVLSKTMAKDSFYLAVVMCILGFIAIGSSIVAIFLVDVSFIETLMPVIGGSVVEVIAGTSLSVYKKSLEQLNHYYESLHNNERYLSLVSLVDRLSDEKKDDAYTSIINSQLELLKKSL